jgi:membrane-associated phospholipid phosphatase
MRWLVCLCLAISTSVAPAYAQIDPTPQTGSAPTPPKAPAPQSDTKEPVPAHARTGWSTLLKDTAQDFVTFPKRPSTWVILGIGAGSAGLAHLEDDYVVSHATGNEDADKAFALGQWVGSMYVQVGSAVGLWAVGRYVVAPIEDEPRTNKVSEIGFDLIRAQILSQGVTQGMKLAFRRDRPTGECCAFPSGHAAAAFAAAAVLERHVGYRASWPAMLGATYVAASRLVDNRHFLSDVLMGAAVGTASGWTVVGRRGPNQFALQPVPVAGGVIVTLTRTND